MQSVDPPQFAFIRKLYPELPEFEIVEAEVRFARLLDILAEVAVEEASRREAGDSDSTAPGVAPYDSSPPPPSL